MTNKFTVFVLALVILLPGVSISAQENKVPTNYDEAMVGDWKSSLPDPLVFANGKKVKRARQWTRKRRAEVVRLFEENQHGKWPAAAPMPIRTEVSEDLGFNGTAVRKQYRLVFSEGEDGTQVDVLVYLPMNAGGRAPLLLNLSFLPNNMVVNDPGVLPGKMRNRGGFGMNETIKKFLDAGFGFATVNYTDITPDFEDNDSLGIRGIARRAAGVPEGEWNRPSDDWGAISAWAWGVGRVMDCLTADKDIDPGRIAFTGCSRLGKTAIWAGAIEPRIAMMIVSCSGEGGMSLSRRNFGETVRDVKNSFPYWFCPRYASYADDVESLPVDSHMLVSLVAPRPLLVQTGKKDDWSDPKGEWVAVVEGAPVYRLLGVDLGDDFKDPDALPEAGEFICHPLAWYMHEEGHGVMPHDWDIYLEFMKKYL